MLNKTIEIYFFRYIMLINILIMLIMFVKFYRYGNSLFKIINLIKMIIKIQKGIKVMDRILKLVSLGLVCACWRSSDGENNKNIIRVT